MGLRGRWKDADRGQQGEGRGCGNQGEGTKPAVIRGRLPKHQKLGLPGTGERVGGVARSKKRLGEPLRCSRLCAAGAPAMFCLASVMMLALGSTVPPRLWDKEPTDWPLLRVIYPRN